MVGVSMEDLGSPMSEIAIKKGLQELNNNLVFDMGGRKDKYHPQIDTRQSVYLACGDGYGRFITSMSRGVVPEWSVWGVKNSNGRKERSHVVRVGWRWTFNRLVNKRVPNVTWDSLRAKFNIDVKKIPQDTEPTEDLK
jgi:hypothetical protein